MGAVAAPQIRTDLIASELTTRTTVRLLRIVPDDTKFDFMRFRRISFPLSAALSIFAIVLYFTHGLNFGIDFQGGTLLEVQAKSGSADLQTMRTTLGGLGLGEV